MNELEKALTALKAELLRLKTSLELNERALWWAVVSAALRRHSAAHTHNGACCAGNHVECEDYRRANRDLWEACEALRLTISRNDT